MQSFLDEGEGWDEAEEPASAPEVPTNESATIDTKAVPASSASAASSPAASGASNINQAADAALAIEPAESYYRRIYSEFTQQRKGAGEEAISYVRFVEKVVRQERVLRNQLSCRMVRFRVVQRDDGPALLPVKID